MNVSILCLCLYLTLSIVNLTGLSSKHDLYSSNSVRYPTVLTLKMSYAKQRILIERMLKMAKSKLDQIMDVVVLESEESLQKTLNKNNQPQK
jgi:hypothetical protein